MERVPHEVSEALSDVCSALVALRSRAQYDEKDEEDIELTPYQLDTVFLDAVSKLNTIKNHIAKESKE
jgi:hypothetical protein